MKVHFTSENIRTMPHDIRVIVVGVGGNGSHLISQLGRIDATLRALGKGGIHVTAYDPDSVSSSNVGRQLFAENEIGLNKAVTLVSKINAFFNTQWTAIPDIFDMKYECNILINCTDSLAFRKELYDNVQVHNSRHQKLEYLIDLGNSNNSGQVVMGTSGVISQPESKYATVDYLPNLMIRYPELNEMDEPDDESVPSCSVAESIAKQDLFINSTLAQYAGQLVWRLLKDQYVTTAGVFVNNDLFQVNAIPV
jgi:PRTRC genetic system ThiF family protein